MRVLLAAVCGKQVTCPGFNDNLSLQWLPYKLNDELVFKSATAVNDTFKISSVSFSSSYQDAITASNPYCTSEGNFGAPVSATNGKIIFEAEVMLRNNQLGNTNDHRTTFRIKDSYFQAGAFSDTGLIKSFAPTVSHFYATATVGGKTFTNIQVVSLDTFQVVLKKPQILRFWIAKNIGLAAYEEYHGNLWVKQ